VLKAITNAIPGKTSNKFLLVGVSLALIDVAMKGHTTDLVMSIPMIVILTIIATLIGIVIELIKPGLFMAILACILACYSLSGGVTAIMQKDLIYLVSQMFLLVGAYYMFRERNDHYAS